MKFASLSEMKMGSNLQRQFKRREKSFDKREKFTSLSPENLQELENKLKIPKNILQNIHKRFRSLDKPAEIIEQYQKSHMLLNEMHTMGFTTETESMNMEMPFSKKNRNEIDYNSYSIPSEFNLKNLQNHWILTDYMKYRIHQPLDYENWIEFPNKTFIEKDYLMDAFKIFFDSSITQLQILSSKKEKEATVIIKGGEYELYIAPRETEEEGEKGIPIEEVLLLGSLSTKEYNEIKEYNTQIPYVLLNNLTKEFGIKLDLLEMDEELKETHMLKNSTGTMGFSSKSESAKLGAFFTIDTRKKEDYQEVKLPLNFTVTNFGQKNYHNLIDLIEKERIAKGMIGERAERTIEIPIGRLYDIDAILDAITIFQKSGIKDIQFLLPKRDEIPVLIITSDNYEFFLAPIVREEEEEEEEEKKVEKKEIIKEFGIPLERMVQFGILSPKQLKNPSNISLEQISPSKFEEGYYEITKTV